MLKTDVQRWIKANNDWLTPDTQPLANSLLILAATIDKQMKDKGQVLSGVATAYRQTYNQLLEMKPKANEDEENDPLLSPEES